MKVNNTEFNYTSISTTDTDLEYTTENYFLNETEKVYLGSDLTRDEDESMYLFIGFGPCAVLAVVILSYISRLAKIPDHLYNALATEHLCTEYLHLFALVLYNSKMKLWVLKDVLEEVYVTLDTVIPFSTFCLAGIAYLKLFLFPNGEQLYTKKEIAVFTTTALTLIELYQLFFININEIFTDDEEEEMVRFDAALKLTSIFLIMSVPIAITGLLLLTLIQLNSSVPKLKALFFSIHLLIFILNDIILVLFNLPIHGEVSRVWYVLLPARIIVEGVWFIFCNGKLAGFLEY